MPFCPKCKYEYLSSVSKCPDCNEELVASLPKESDLTDDNFEKYKDWIPLARFNSDQIAALAIDSLRSKDIPAVVLSGTGHFGMTGQMGISSFRPVGGSYTLLVPEEYIVIADHESAIIFGDEWEKIKLLDLEEEN